ncbi:uncharacterized protein [Rutidosis leptorrhynchoides]|uniref:uncharacterized protein isoform X3 n=1 Tax=Rutidosis leptorrhynchoides TaxID=125765 RepID=UPI003A9A05B9
MSRTCKLFYAIFQFLLLYQGPIVDFTLSMRISDATDDYPEIDQILLHLSRKNTVKKLRINHLPSFNGYGNLTTLCLEYVRIDRKTLKQFLSNNPQLKSFTMVSHNSTWIFTEDEYETMNALFQCLPVIENLTLCVSEIQHLRRGMVPRELATSLVHLKYLCLERMCFLENDWLRFLVLMTRSSPDLEKLRLQVTGITLNKLTSTLLQCKIIRIFN